MRKAKPLVAKDLHEAFQHLRDLVPKNMRLHDRHTTINWSHFGEVLKKPFAQIGKAYESGAALSVKKINGAFAQARQRVRFRKGLGMHYAKAADVFNFDLYTPEVQQALRDAQDALIQQLIDSSRDAIEQVVMDGALQGLSAADLVDDIRAVIGLTDTQAQAVMNYQAMLETLDPTALERQLRNTTMDQLVQDAIDAGDFLPSDTIDQMVQDYADNYLEYRASTIAQTESVRAVNAGLHDAYSQAIDRGALPADAVHREWELGDSPCPICESIPDNNPDGVGVDEEFESDDGPVDDPPIHPNCMCSVNYITDISQVPDDTESGSGSYDTASTQAEEFT